MGGRKSYPLEAVVGKTAENAGARKRLVTSIRSQESKQIVSRTLELFTRSDKALDSLVEAVRAFDFVRSNAQGPELSSGERKRLASRFWANRKKEIDAPPNAPLDNIIVDSLAKTIRKGKRK